MVSRRRYIKSVKRAVAAARQLRVTLRKRLQDRRTGGLYGSVPGATSKFRSRIRAVRSGLRHRRR